MKEVHYCHLTKSIVDGFHNGCCEKDYIDFFAERNESGKIIESYPLIQDHYIAL